mmetsp:Transcript_90976/g.262257  ORF Transcript_90976/g.262257 Transcript_90976/m.262257 type:complete len:209 (+) Transcript_90976:247-873(+)
MALGWKNAALGCFALQRRTGHQTATVLADLSVAEKIWRSIIASSATFAGATTMLIASEVSLQLLTFSSALLSEWPPQLLVNAAAEGEAEGDADTPKHIPASSGLDPSAALSAAVAPVSGSFMSACGLRFCLLLQMGQRKTLRGLWSHHCCKQSAWKVCPHCVTRTSSPASRLHKQTTQVSSPSAPSNFVTGNRASMSAKVVFFRRSRR